MFLLVLIKLLLKIHKYYQFDLDFFLTKTYTIAKSFLGKVEWYAVVSLERGDVQRTNCSQQCGMAVCHSHPVAAVSVTLPASSFVRVEVYFFCISIFYLLLTWCSCQRYLFCRYLSLWIIYIYYYCFIVIRY